MKRQYLQRFEGWKIKMFKSSKQMAKKVGESLSTSYKFAVPVQKHCHITKKSMNFHISRLPIHQTEGIQSGIEYAFPSYHFASTSSQPFIGVWALLQVTQDHFPSFSNHNLNVLSKKGSNNRQIRLPTLHPSTHHDAIQRTHSRPLPYSPVPDLVIWIMWPIVGKWKVTHVTFLSSKDASLAAPSYQNMQWKYNIDADTPIITYHTIIQCLDIETIAQPPFTIY